MVQVAEHRSGPRSRFVGGGRCLILFLLGGLLIQASPSQAGRFKVTQIADENLVNRGPVISETGLVVWHTYAQNDKGESFSDVFIHQNGETRSLTRGVMDPLAANPHPRVQSNTVVWVSTFSSPGQDLTWTLKQVPPKKDQPEELDATFIAHAEADGAGGSLGRQWFTGPSTNPAGTGTLAGVVTNFSRPRRHPSGDAEICLWDGGEIRRITQDTRNDLAPSAWGHLVAWQKAKGWPFGWEIMFWDDGFRNQLTTNYYYDMSPVVQGRRIAWYGWDGHDFEIYLYDRDKDTTIQVTSNRYDDVSPVLWGDLLAWEAYPTVEADIHAWKNGKILKIGENPEDDINPAAWNGKVVWQGFDDRDHTVKLTDNDYDDIKPDIRDGLVCWMGYFENWDAEIFVWDGTNITRLTDNDYEDRDPHTAGGRLVWQAVDTDGHNLILLAEPSTTP